MYLFLPHSVQAFKQLDSHTHGEIELNIAVEANRVYLELESPAVNLVGFEHPPKDESDHKIIEHTEEYLEAAKWLKLNPVSQCQLHTSKVQNTFSVEDEHEHKDEHDDDEEHAQFTAQYEYKCKSIEQLKSIDVMLFTDYPNVHKITANIVTTKQQNSFTLSKNNSRISLD
ncbi:MAG: DUF2796 domain-containing protein [Bacteroidota bacterium]